MEAEAVAEGCAQELVVKAAARRRRDPQNLVDGVTDNTSVHGGGWNQHCVIHPGIRKEV